MLGLSPVLRGWLAGIRRGSQRLAHVTHQIIQMLLAGRFEGTLQRQPTDLAVLVAAADDVRPFLEHAARS